MRSLKSPFKSVSHPKSSRSAVEKYGCRVVDGREESETECENSM